MTGSYVAWLLASSPLTSAGLGLLSILTGASVSSTAYPLVSRDNTLKFKRSGAATTASFFNHQSKKDVAGRLFLALSLISRACHCFTFALAAFFALLFFSLLAFYCATVQLDIFHGFIALFLPPFGLLPTMVVLSLLSINTLSSSSTLLYSPLFLLLATTSLFEGNVTPLLLCFKDLCTFFNNLNTNLSNP